MKLNSTLGFTLAAALCLGAWTGAPTAFAAGVFPANPLTVIRLGVEK